MSRRQPMAFAVTWEKGNTKQKFTIERLDEHKFLCKKQPAPGQDPSFEEIDFCNEAQHVLEDFVRPTFDEPTEEELLELANRYGFLFGSGQGAESLSSWRETIRNVSVMASLIDQIDKAARGERNFLDRLFLKDGKNFRYVISPEAFLTEGLGWFRFRSGMLHDQPKEMIFEGLCETARDAVHRAGENPLLDPSREPFVLDEWGAWDGSDTIDAARRLAKREISKALSWVGACVPNVEYKDGEFSMNLSVRTLQGLLWLALAEWLAGRKHYSHCRNPYCDRIFEVTSSKRGSTREYCPFCDNATQGNGGSGAGRRAYALLRKRVLSILRSKAGGLSTEELEKAIQAVRKTRTIPSLSRFLGDMERDGDIAEEQGRWILVPNQEKEGECSG